MISNAQRIYNACTYAAPVSYGSPIAGLPAPDPLPIGTYHKPKKRKRYNPKNPWYHAYDGDQWRRPHARDTYRFHIYIWRGIRLCRVSRHGEPTDTEGTTIINSEFRFAGPNFKRIAVELGLKPVKRPNKYRKGPTIDFWDWPPGFVTD